MNPTTSRIAPFLALALDSPSSVGGRDAHHLSAEPRAVRRAPSSRRPRSTDRKAASVVLQIAISETGEVVNVEVLESAGEAFDEAAVEAVRQFLFEPATKDAKPIPVRIAYRYEFVWKPDLVKKTTADFEGVVRDRATKAPLSGVEVQLRRARRRGPTSRAAFVSTTSSPAPGR